MGAYILDIGWYYIRWYSYRDGEQGDGFRFGPGEKGIRRVDGP